MMTSTWMTSTFFRRGSLAEAWLRSDNPRSDRHSPFLLGTARVLKSLRPPHAGRFRVPIQPPSHGCDPLWVRRRPRPNLRDSLQQGLGGQLKPKGHDILDGRPGITLGRPALGLQVNAFRGAVFQLQMDAKDFYPLRAGRQGDFVGLFDPPLAGEPRGSFGPG